MSHHHTPSIVPLQRRFNMFNLILALFTLGNSSDAFLLLRLTDVAGSVKFIPLMWSALHVVKASVSVLGGDWSDRVGRRTVIAIGWLVYAAVYVGFAVSASPPVLLGWFLVYGSILGLPKAPRKRSLPISHRRRAAGLRLASTQPSKASARSRPACCSASSGTRSARQRHSAWARRSRSRPRAC